MELGSMLCGSLEERGVWGEWLLVYVWLSPFTVYLKLSQCCLSIVCIPVQNKKFKKFKK